MTSGAPSRSKSITGLLLLLCVSAIEVRDAEAQCGNYQKYNHVYYGSPGVGYLAYNLNAFCTANGWCGSDIGQSDGVSCSATTPPCYSMAKIENKVYSCVTLDLELLRGRFAMQ